MTKQQIKEYKDLASELNGKNEKEIMFLLSNTKQKILRENYNICDFFNYEEGEYIDLFTKTFTLTYYFNEKKLQTKDIYVWDIEDGEDYRLVDYKGATNEK